MLSYKVAVICLQSQFSLGYFVNSVRTDLHRLNGRHFRLHTLHQQKHNQIHHSTRIMQQLLYSHYTGVLDGTLT